jgi:two-component system, chemotaxis family, CheB/CheR fusion protein
MVVQGPVEYKRRPYSAAGLVGCGIWRMPGRIPALTGERCGSMDQESEFQPKFLVVIGTSAGGLESVCAIVGRIPGDFAAPIVIGMHVSPTRVSGLQRILSERTSLPVISLEDRVQLCPGTIYVVPSNHNVQIQDGHALLTSDNPGSQPSVDLLFRSAAEAYGENLIAVVLSGTGSDGSIGARFVKSHGGTVIVQNPDTASSPGLPLSLSLSDVSLTANVERIPSLLKEFVNGGFAVPAATEDSALRSFLEDLREESGVDFTTYRQTTIQRRIQSRMAATGMASFPEYLRMIRRNEEERLHLVKSFLINVT